MVHKSKPRAGSLAFYPRKRAKRELASFTSALGAGTEAKALNFLGYKAGMTHVIGKDAHEKGKTFGQDIFLPCTVIECPPLTVFGVRAYSKKYSSLQPLGDVFAQKNEKELLRKIRNFRKKSKKEKLGKEAVKEKSLADFEQSIGRIGEFRLLVHSQPRLAGIGKKKPEVFEVMISGSKEKQLAFAVEKLGKQLDAKDCFEEKQFLDVRAVTKGKGFQGVVKRFGVKTHRPKSKKERVVGSIGPWHPATVMWTVPRPGQHGYHSRTQFNTRILKIGENGGEINPASGFRNYGMVKNAFLLVSGSIGGPAKRVVSLRRSIRKVNENQAKLAGIDFIATKAGESAATEAEVKARKAEAVKQEKQERKSVAEEIAEAVKK